MSNKKDKINEVNLMKNGMKAKIIAYRNYEDIDVKFEDGYISYNKNYGAFKRGSIKNPNIKNKSKLLMHNRLGEITYNKFGRKLEIINYNNYDDITVKIYDKDFTTIRTRYKYFKNKNIFSPYDKTVYNVGYIGLPLFKDNESYEKLSELKSYKFWVGMLDRCYYSKRKLPTYKDCSVCEEWLCFQNFKIWFDNNYYEIENQTMNLDKDILVKGNKIYNPVNCIFVPHDINMLFVKANSIRGDLPLGVYHDYTRNCYASKISIKNKTKNLGRYYNKEEAFNAYKEFKEKYIKQVADDYKDKIPKKLYEAMYNWEVEITD